MSLPDWLEPLYDGTQMRAIDAWAIERQGVPSLELMERAGEGLAALASELAPSGEIAIVAGKGNNAGDGFVAARLLAAAGREVSVLMAGDGAALSGDAAVNFARLAEGIVRPLADGIPAAAALVVDAVLGTGASGEPRGEALAAIEAIRDSRVAVLAADVPSGVDASSGETPGAAVCAAATATFHAAKLGLRVEPGRSCSGRVSVVDIGMPAGAPVAARAGLISDSVLGLVPHRGVHSTKFSSGRVLVAGGSAGLTGAPSLAALAAARAGAGYVTACVPASLSLVFESRLLEAMTIALPDLDGAHTPEGVAGLIEAASARGGALVLGPGLGRSDGAAEFARRVLEGVEVPVVLDADGLNAFAGAIDALGGNASVLTPHEGELARLLGLASSEAVAAARVAHARDAASRAQAVVVLKGDDTLVADPGGLVAVSGGASPALATAGTGDVLAGVIGAMLAKGLEPFAAACAGVRLHALAGIRAGAARGVDSVIASDVVEELGAVLRS